MSEPRIPYPFESDTIVEFVAPTDVANQIPLSGPNSSATFKVYDPGKDEELSAVAALGATTLLVVNAAVFQVGDSIELTQDNDTLIASTITAVDAVAGSVDIADVTTFAAAVGNRFRVIFGTVHPMVDFGTPVLGKRDYGFRGLLGANDPVQILDQEFNIEIRVEGTAGGGLDLLDLLCGVIKPRGECDCG